MNPHLKMLRRKKKGQIAIEFLLLTTIGFFMLLGTTAMLTKMTYEKNSEKTMNEAQDLGKSIQQEIITAAKVENGYLRKYTIPQKIDEKMLTIENGKTLINTSYYVVKIEDAEYYFDIPYIIGNITTGTNIIRKQNNTVFVN